MSIKFQHDIILRNALKHDVVLEPFPGLQQASRPQAAVTDFISTPPPNPVHHCRLESDAIFTTEQAGRSFTNIPPNHTHTCQHLYLSSRLKGEWQAAKTHTRGNTLFRMLFFLSLPLSRNFKNYIQNVQKCQSF